MKYHIYQLTYNNKPFYIGRTIDPARREAEHRRDMKRGQELKYQFMREIESWEMSVIATYSDSKYNYEDFHIYQALCQGCELTNMTKGSVYEEFNNIATKKGILRHTKPAEYFRAHTLYQEKLKQSKITLNSYKKRASNSNSTAFIDTCSTSGTPDRQESKGLATLRAKNNKKR